MLLLYQRNVQGVIEQHVSHAGTEREEHIQLIITLAQEADNVIPHQVRLLV